MLGRFVEQARGVVDSGLDRKWDELSKILQNDPNMRDAGGRQRSPASSRHWGVQDKGYHLCRICFFPRFCFSS